MRSGICIYSSTKNRSCTHTFFLLEYLSSALRLNKALAVFIFFRAHEDLNTEKRRSVNRVKKGYSKSFITPDDGFFELLQL